MTLKHSPRAPGAHEGLPYRAATDAARPARLRGLALPPGRMPLHLHGRPLKAWRYVAFFAPDLMVCLARVRLGAVPDAFWAVLHRPSGLFWSGRRTVTIDDAGASITSRRLEVAVTFTPGPGVEAICPAGSLYAWTAKRALAAAATLRIGTTTRRLAGTALIDDTAAYYPRHTRWFWSAGAGQTPAGQPLAWNLVSGVNDPPRNSERTIWVDGVPSEPGPSTFAEDLSAVDDLTFTAEATLRRRTNFGLVRSDYRQPLGTFSGSLPGGIAVGVGLGVMERHDAWW